MADEQQQAAAPATPPATSANAPQGSPVLVLGQYNHVHKNESDMVDSLEFGPAANRGKVYFNANRPEEAKQKIANMLTLMEAAAAGVREKGLDAGKKGA